MENDRKTYKSMDSTTSADGLTRTAGSSCHQKLHKVVEVEVEVEVEEGGEENSKVENRDGVEFEVKKNSVLPVEKGKATRWKSKPLEGKLSRQVSLGTGFSNWNKENGNRPNILERSGASFGGFSSSSSKDRNYSLFRTQSHNTMLQARKMVEELERQDVNIEQSRVHVNLPAGRYFDALKGPELDVLKVVRINLFRGFRFSVAWWAYTFPMTAASIATIKYSETVKCTATITLAMLLSIISSTTVLTLLVATLLHATWGSLFPNDLAIAITDKRYKSKALKENKKKAAKLHASPIQQAGNDTKVANTFHSFS